MMQTIKMRLFLLLSTLGFFLLPIAAGAAVINPQEEFNRSLQTGGITKDLGKTTTPEVFVGRAINTVLTYIGVAILALVIYAGILWATARGNDQQIAKAKQILLGAIIGLIIIFTAAGAVNFVITRLGSALGN